jgi:hypothetical protein
MLRLRRGSGARPRDSSAALSDASFVVATKKQKRWTHRALTF